MKLTKLTWQDITVQQYQDIYRLSLNTSLDEIDKVTRVICILFNMSEAQVENLTMSEFNDLSRECAFVLSGEIPGKPVKSIRIGARKYAIEYNPVKLRHRQYVEILHFSDKPVENMHYILASLVQPVKYGFKQKNNAEDHEAIANDMLNAKVVDVFNSCVFFCNLYVNLIKVIRDSLVAEMIAKGIPKKEAETALEYSLSVMAGFIAPGKLRSLNV